MSAANCTICVKAHLVQFHCTLQQPQGMGINVGSGIKKGDHPVAFFAGALCVNPVRR